MAEPEGFGPYWLLERMAEGRLGPVYRACLRREGKPDKLLALKRIAPSVAAEIGFRERFSLLMGDVANVVHPALCSVEDVGTGPDGDPYVAFEYVTGRDLGRIHAGLAHRGQALPPALAAFIVNQVADGLAAAHRATHGGKPAPLLHGELALSDILIGYDGSVRLIGIGSRALAALVPGIAARGNRAPELERGAPGDARSDVFSLGACMYELLTGGPALRGAGSSDSSSLPRPQSHITRVVPRALQPIMTRALADDPAARYQSATELGRALRRWSIEQSTPADAAALQTFLRGQLDAERSADEAWLQSALARVPAARNSGMAPSGDFAARLRAQGRTPRALPAPERAAAGRAHSTHENYDDLAERTPARGHLMNELAATMSGAPSPLQENTESSIRETMRAEVPAAEWSDQTPVTGWISSSEEEDAQARRAAAESRRAASRAPAPRPQPAATVAHASAASTSPSPQTARRAPQRRQTPAWLIVLLAAGVAAAAIAIFSLLRGQPSAQLSTLQVQTHPEGAEVLVQGERIGTSPLRLEHVASGTIKLELRKSGFEKLTRMIELAPGQVFQLDIDLTSRKMEVKSTPIVAAAPPPVAKEGDEAEASEQSSARRSRQESSRWEPRRRRDEGAQARSAEPRSAEPRSAESASAGETAPVSQSGSTPSANSEPAAVEPVAVVTPVEAPVASVEAKASQPPAPAAASKPAASKPAAAPRGPSRAASVLSQVTPRFPARARRAGISSGAVTLEYTVDRSGAVRDAKVVKADPPGMFDDVALGAIEKWRYQPKLDAGKPVDSRVRFTFRFAE